MPAISMFYGIIVYMYFMDNKQHNRPHIPLSIKVKKWSLQYLMARFLMVVFRTQK